MPSFFVRSLSKILRTFPKPTYQQVYLRQFSIDTKSIELVTNLRTMLAAHVLAVKEKVSIPGRVDVDNLTKRTMGESTCRALLPFKNDAELRKQYISPFGALRFGKILEDLDTFAVWLAYRHNQGLADFGKPPSHHPMCIVTACVDQIDLHEDAIPANRDVILQGFISHNGTSSMEATIDVLQQADEGMDSWTWSHVLQAKFVMVAVDPNFSGKTVPVHPLVCETEEERAVFEKGETAKRKRQKWSQDSLLKIPPTETERQILHNLFLQTLDPKLQTFRNRFLPRGYCWMENTKLKNVIMCFPQEKNLYNKIFGGFLMRSAFELAFANAMVFSNSHPLALAVDNIMFRKSVDIGSLLFLSSEQQTSTS